MLVYPVNLRKYTGGIQKRNNKYVAQIYTANFQKSKTHESYEDAYDWIITQNIENNLPIANLMTERQSLAPDGQISTYYEVELTKGFKTLVDKEDFDKVDEHVWSSCTMSPTRCAPQTRTQKNKNMYLYNHILGHTPSELTVDHVNGNPLDNRRQNLRIVDRSAQMINRAIFKTNTTGTTGVSFNKTTKQYVATWRDDDIYHVKTFSTKKYGEDQAKQLAVNIRKQKELELPKYQYMRVAV